jgi:hypothetical protein
MDLLTGIVVAGLAWHVVLIGAVYAFDLGGGDGIQPKAPPEEDLLDSDTFSREFGDD